MDQEHTLNEFEKQALSLVFIELEKAKEKHPLFPSEAGGVCVILEELGELAQAVNDMRSCALPLEQAEEHILEEAAHTAVTSLRMIATLLKQIEERE